MQDFEFSAYLNVLKNIQAKNDNERKRIAMNKTLEAMSQICPGSYMPFVFLYAGTRSRLHFVPMHNRCKDVHEAFTLKKSYLLNYMKEHKPIATAFSDAIASDCEDDFVKKLALDCFLEVTCLSGSEGAEENEDYVCFWDFREYFEYDDGDISLQEASIGDNCLKSAIDTMMAHDPFFTAKYDKAIYFILVSFLRHLAIPALYEYENPFDESDVISLWNDQKDWIDIYDQMILKQYNQHHPELLSLPDGLIRVVDGLLHTAGKEAEHRPLYDPFNNLGLFALNINAQMCCGGRPQEAPDCFVSDADDDETICATTARLLFRGCPAEFGIDPLQHNPVNYVTIPPFGKTIVADGTERDATELAVEKGLAFAQKGNQMACVVPSMFLLDERYRKTWMNLIKSELDTKIVSFPQEALPGTLPLSIIYVNGKESSGWIKFVDASNYVSIGRHFTNYNVENDTFEHGPEVVRFDCAEISNLLYHDQAPVIPKPVIPKIEDIINEKEDELYGAWGFEFGNEVWYDGLYWEDDPDNIAQNEFGNRIYCDIDQTAFERNMRMVSVSTALVTGSLNPSLYFNRPVIPRKGFDLKRLSDFLREVESCTSEKRQGKKITPKLLRESNDVFELDTDGIPVDEVEKGSLAIGEFPCFVLSTQGRPHCTLVRSGEDVYADGITVLGYTLISSEIDADYLAREMRKSYLETQIQATDFFIKHFTNKNPLSNIRVFVPLAQEGKTSLEIQKEIVEKELKTRNSELETQVKRLSSKSLNEYVKDLRQRKHRLSQVLNQLCPAFELLNAKRLKNGGMLRDQDVVAARTGENVGQYFDKVTHGLEKIVTLVDELVDKNQWGKPEKFAIEDFIKEFSEQHICNNYRIVWAGNESGETDLHLVFMPKDELANVLENIIANAEKWGFTNEKRTDYAVIISIELADMGENIILHVANNGTPIHPSVDRSRIFDWGVGSHTGLGTWQARNIVEHYGGKIEIKEHPEAQDGFQTEYIITLQREF